jgi:tRNA-dihydrouridine synthase B
VLRIGHVAVDPPLVLAPMAGITDQDFRLLIRRIGGCGLVSMEFVSSEGISRDNPKTLQMLEFSQEERPLSVQLYGADPDRMAAAARVVEATGADVCDINMGCPARKILRGKAGAALAADPDRARAVISAVRAAITIPVTVKLRLGSREDTLNYVELCRIAEGEGVQAVALHARTARQQYAGQADWSHIARLREHVSIPVIGNGDVTTPQDVRRMFALTGCDGVMVGRAALTNPWIFAQAAAELKGNDMADPSLRERSVLIRSHLTDVLERENDRVALHKLRKFVGWYSHGLPEGRLLRRQLSELATASDVMGAVENYFSAKVA